MTTARTIDITTDRHVAVAARRFITATIAEWGLDVIGDDAALVVSELVTNAVIHAPDDAGTRRVHVRRTATGIRIVVTDGSTEPPRMKRADGKVIGGRGLRIVDSLSSSWGHEPIDGGKEVWADVDLPGTTS